MNPFTNPDPLVEAASKVLKSSNTMTLDVTGKAPKDLKKYVKALNLTTVKIGSVKYGHTPVTGDKEELKRFFVYFMHENDAIKQYPELYKGDPKYKFDPSREFRRL